MSQRTTRAFVLESLGYEGLRERAREISRPARGQVLVRMRAASLNYRDLKILKGTYARRPQLPLVLLSDGAGDVIEIGDAVTRFKEGDRIMPVYMEGWFAGPITATRDGWKSRGGDIDGLATEYALVGEENLLPIPSSMTYEQAACLPCAGVTAWHSLISAGQLKPGDTVLVQGSGGVSTFALQIAKLAGARVIAMSSDDEKLARLIDLGAWHGINYRSEPRWEDKVRELTRGDGVDQVVEVGGTGTIRQSLRATRDAGHVGLIGDLTGGFAPKALTERGIRVSPIVVGSRQMAQDLMRAIEPHRQAPVIDSRFAFADLKRALAHLESGRHFGKIVLTF